MSKYYAIGDIHGMLSKLEALLATIPIDKDRDTLIFLGDYIDRGPHSRGVIQRIIDLKDEGYKVIALKGNHEAVFLEFLKGRFDYWSYRHNFEGQSTLRDYSYDLNYMYTKKTVGNPPDVREHFLYEDEEGRRLLIPLTHLHFLESLPLYYETDEFIFVHAGLYPHVPLIEQKEQDLLWIKAKFLLCEAPFEKIVVHGHTAAREPVVTQSKIGIDTGACYGGKLTCVCLPGLKFYSV